MTLSRSDLKQWLKERGITEFDYPRGARDLIVELPYETPRVWQVCAAGRLRYHVRPLNTEHHFVDAVKGEQTP